MTRSKLLRTGTAIVAILAVLAGGVAVTQATTADNSATLVGYFTDAGSLRKWNVVRAAGVQVGTVEHIQLVDGKAKVTMEVDPAVLPVHGDARLTIRPVDLLGELYVELDPGSAERPFAAKAVIPDKRTTLATTLQDVFNMFDKPASGALAAMLTTLGEGMRGSGADAAAAIKALAPAMRRADDLGGVLREQNAVLGGLIDQVQPVASALAAKKGNSLDRLAGSTERMLATLAANRRALDATVAELPATLAEARRTLRGVTGVANATTPTLRAVRPTTDNLTAITGELQRFADTADPALASLRPVLGRADELFEMAGPVARQLRAAGPDLRTTAAKLRPLGSELLDEHLGNVMAFVKKWALSTNSRDALSHYFRGVFFVTPRTLKDLAQSVLPAQSAGGKTPLSPVDPDTVLPEPDTVLPNISSQASRTTDPGNATGLSPQQEQSMLDQLLGGS